MRHLFAAALVLLAVAQPALAEQIELETEVFTLSATLDPDLGACVVPAGQVPEGDACAWLVLTRPTPTPEGQVRVYLPSDGVEGISLRVMGVSPPVYAETVRSQLAESMRIGRERVIDEVDGAEVLWATQSFEPWRGIPTVDDHTEFDMPHARIRLRSVQLAGTRGIVNVTARSLVDDAARANAAMEQLLGGLQIEPAPYRGVDPTQPFDALMAQCDAGNTAACGLVAFDLALGLQTDADPVTALSLARPACDAGDVSGCAALANLLRDRVLYTEQEAADADLVAEAIAANVHVCEREMPAHALVVLERAFGPPACQTAGMLLDSEQADDVGLRDTRRAAIYFERACEEGEDVIREMGCRSLGLALLDGEPSAAEAQRAIELLVPRCEAGDARACRVGVAFFEVSAVPFDFDRADALLRQGCDLRDTYSCVALEDLIELRAYLAGDLGRPEPEWYERLPLWAWGGILAALLGMLLLVRQQD